jgi:hypothetical protein
MRKITLILGCYCILLVSCEKKYLLPEKELPHWLKISIDNDMEIISQNPKSWKALGSWIRTEWNNEYYYEYHNNLSSKMYHPISHYQDTLRVDISTAISNYFNEKCCEVYVWKGPSVN